MDDLRASGEAQRNGQVMACRLQAAHCIYCPKPLGSLFKQVECASAIYGQPEGSQGRR